MINPTCTRHEWIAPDGEAFPYSVWGANLKTGLLPRAIVVAVHGLSGAALDFEPLGAHISPHGVLTFALELRGQGSDPDPKRRGDLRQPRRLVRRPQRLLRARARQSSRRADLLLRREHGRGVAHPLSRAGGPGRSTRRCGARVARRRCAGQSGLVATFRLSLFPARASDASRAGRQIREARSKMCAKNG